MSTRDCQSQFHRAAVGGPARKTWNRTPLSRTAGEYERAVRHPPLGLKYSFHTPYEARHEPNLDAMRMAR